MHIKFWEYYRHSDSPEEIYYNTSTDQFFYKPSQSASGNTKEWISRVVHNLNSELQTVDSYKQLYLLVKLLKGGLTTIVVEKHANKIVKQNISAGLHICKSDILIINDEETLWVPMTDKMKELIEQLEVELTLFRKDETYGTFRSTRKI
jgi:hypothetical protein